MPPRINPQRVTPQFFVSVAEPLEQVIRGIEDQLLLNVARVFKQSPDDWKIPGMQWAAKKMTQLGVMHTANVRAISKLAGQAHTMYQLALQKTLWKALKAADADLFGAWKAGLLQGNPGSMDDAVARQLRLYEQQAINRLNMVNTVMLNSSLKQAQQVISNTQAYERQLDRAQQILNARTGEVVTGVSTRQQAVRRAILDMNREGLTGFTDRAGRSWSPEAYVSMDVRTTAHNCAVEAAFSRADEYGCSLVEVSSHAGARPRCEPFQGRIYDRNNTSGTVTDLHGKAIHYEPWSSTSYGEAAGLLGINCGHFVYPFVPGYSVQRNHPTENKKENDRIYQESQQQRAIERTIRNHKRAAGLLQAAGDAEGAAKENAKVRAAQAQMRDFCEATGRTRRRDRQQVYGK